MNPQKIAAIMNLAMDEAVEMGFDLRDFRKVLDRVTADIERKGAGVPMWVVVTMVFDRLYVMLN